MFTVDGEWEMMRWWWSRDCRVDLFIKIVHKIDETNPSKQTKRELSGKTYQTGAFAAWWWKRNEFLRSHAKRRDSEYYLFVLSRQICVVCVVLDFLIFFFVALERWGARGLQAEKKKKFIHTSKNTRGLPHKCYLHKRTRWRRKSPPSSSSSPSLSSSFPR